LLLEKHPDVDVIIHLASQVAVTTSVIDPQNDFNVNLIGTFNMLEYARGLTKKPVFLFSSTNKVYGALEANKTSEKELRYEFIDSPEGVDESAPLDFHSPYGCSKGGADQYVRDYHRIYGIPTVVFRQSCIYGENQYGVEDQGWLAWFLIAGILGKDVYLYGNGKQVRDVLHVTDLADAFDRAIENIDRVKGEIFNIGGGPKNSVSILELLLFMENKLRISIKPGKREIRAGDQKIFISDNAKISRILGWKPTTDFETGIVQLHSWLLENMETVKRIIS